MCVRSLSCVFDNHQTFCFSASHSFCINLNCVDSSLSAKRGDRAHSLAGQLSRHLAIGICSGLLRVGRLRGVIVCDVCMIHRTHSQPNSLFCCPMLSLFTRVISTLT